MELDDSVRTHHRRPFLRRNSPALASATSRPEAAWRSGAIGLIEPGDIIEIDIPGHKLVVNVSDDELAERAKTYEAPAPRFTKGYLAKYATMATSANTGAVLKWD